MFIVVVGLLVCIGCVGWGGFVVFCCIVVWLVWG